MFSISDTKWQSIVASGIACLFLIACRPSALLTVPPPTGVVTSDVLHSQGGAEDAFYAARQAMAYAAVGDGCCTALFQMTGLLTDEFSAGWVSAAFTGPNVDARMTSLLGTEPGDEALQGLLAARSALLVAESVLQQYELGSGEARIGEALALVGYTELLMAEAYCAGVPLSREFPGGGVIYGTPLTTDSLLETAELHFDSALTHAAENDTIIALASVGLGRTRLDRGNYAGAAAAVASVSTNFVYNLLTPTSYTSILAEVNFYQSALARCGSVTVSDREGGNGLDFISAQDPRLVLDPTLVETCDGGAQLPDSVYNYPVKFGNPSTTVPLATGIEARLVGAEVALAANQPTWADSLRALRADTADTHVVFPAADSLPTDSAETATETAQVDFLFRERAFWLFGTGTRLGDLRRLIRQYHRQANTVFPTGSYAPGNNPALASYLVAPMPTYGNDVNLTLPTVSSGTTTANPYYKGCYMATTATA